MRAEPRYSSTNESGEHCLKGPVSRQTEGVDQTVPGSQERVQADKLVPVHLLVLARPSYVPVTSHPLQGSKQVSDEDSVFLGEIKGILMYFWGRL